MRRAVVSVGTDHYQNGLERLEKSVKKFSPEAKFAGWNALPKEWPTHQDKPYAFKAHALATASYGADLLIWADAAVVAVKPMEPLWERIESEGYWFPLNGWTNYEWTADSAYEDLFPGIPIDVARGINKRFPQVVATTFGINIRKPIGMEFLKEYLRLSNTNAFCGPWTNSNSSEAQNWKQDPSRMGPCGPSDVLGHRHDQTAASLIAYRLKMKLEQCPGFFGYNPPAESVVLCAVGA